MTLQALDILEDHQLSHALVDLVTGRPWKFPTVGPGEQLLVMEGRLGANKQGTIVDIQLILQDCQDKGNCKRKTQLQ